MKKAPVKKIKKITPIKQLDNQSKKIEIRFKKLDEDITRLTDAIRRANDPVFEKQEMKQYKETCDVEVKAYKEAVKTLKANCIELTEKMQDFEKLKKESIELKETNTVLRGMLVKKGKIL